MKQHPWWQGAVIYQIYPRSYMDANNDGIGDLPGIIEKMPYVKSLGVDAIWVSPFFKSPMADFGYDISDYRDIDPMFGNIADFDELMAEAKKHDIKIMIDQVLSHTSDKHPWFEESRQNKTNPKADWYVWVDANPDGTPPNNWLSIFGGVAWQWEPRRGQYYLHNFLTSQPDLNFHNPEVRQATLDNIEYWLQKGVDGFRLDAINFCFHDQELRDNPAKPKSDLDGAGFNADNPYAYQYHYYNNTRPECEVFMEDIRALTDKYPNKVTLGEIGAEDCLQTMADYTRGDNRLHMAYSFELLGDDGSPAHIRHTIEELAKKSEDVWPCWAIGNHDVKRVASRWAIDGEISAEQAKMYNAMLFSLRGSICSYQGEELGLGEADVAFEDLQDPYGITFWPNFKGRDGCRTPMVWKANQKQAGFTGAEKAWLPVEPAHQAIAVDVQEKDNDSVLSHYRAFLAWRKSQASLLKGDIEFVDSQPETLVFKRVCGDDTLLACFNFSNTEQTITLPAGAEFIQLDGISAADNGKLAPFGVAYYQL